MFCRNGLSRYPGVRRVNIPSNASPPNSTVGTAISRASDIAQARAILLEHLQPAHPQLIDLQFIDA
jgi:hypothetical protein